MSGESSQVTAVARGLISEGLYDAADDALRAAAPTPEVLTLWGQALLLSRKYEQAQWKLTRALDDDPDDVEALTWLGFALLGQRLVDDAAARFGRALQLDVSHAVAWEGQGHVLVERTELDAAVSAFQKALERDPTRWEAQVALATTLNELERFDEAWESANAATQAAETALEVPTPELFEGYYAAAWAAMSLRLFGDARDFIQRRLDLRPPPADEYFAAEWDYSDGLDHLLLGTIHSKLGHEGTALTHFDIASVSHPAWEAGGIRGSAGVYAALGDFPKAYSALYSVANLDEIEWLTGEPARYRTWARAEALLLLGKFDDAREVCERLVAADREDLPTWALLTSIHREHAESLPHPEAARERSRAREAGFHAMRLLVAGLERSKTVERLAGAALIAIAIGDHHAARKHLREAVELDPSDSQVWFLKGLAHARDGDFDRAIEGFARAAQLDPENRTTRVHLGAAHLRLGNPARAEEEFRRVVQVADGEIDAHVGLGETLIVIGEDTDPAALDEAIEHFTRALSLDASMNDPDPGRREGSSKLGRLQRAAVYYGRGYARVSAYEAKPLLKRTAGRDLLKRARRDFGRCCELDPTHGRARRALLKVAPHVTPAPADVLTRVAPMIVSLLALTVVAAASANFLIGWPDKRLLGPTEWTFATLGGLVLLVGGLTLPDLLKLKVGGVELEKGPDLKPVEEVGLVKGDLGPFQMSIPTASVPANVPVGGKTAAPDLDTSAATAATRGADPEKPVAAREAEEGASAAGRGQA